MSLQKLPRLSIVRPFEAVEFYANKKKKNRFRFFFLALKIPISQSVGAIISAVPQRVSARFYRPIDQVDAYPGGGDVLSPNPLGRSVQTHNVLSRAYRQTKKKRVSNERPKLRKLPGLPRSRDSDESALRRILKWARSHARAEPV